jgi:hypothetical protein
VHGATANSFDVCPVQALFKALSPYNYDGDAVLLSSERSLLVGSEPRSSANSQSRCSLLRPRITTGCGNGWQPILFSEIPGHFTLDLVPLEFKIATKK